MNKVYKKRRRTEDVTENEISFSSLFVKEEIIKALNENGFQFASPVQQKGFLIFFSTKSYTNR
jgi:superfamily II DNA/RNA helicase